MSNTNNQITVRAAAAMANTNNQITVPAVVELCESLGCEVQKLKSNWIKVTSPTANRKALYIGNAKRFMTRLDISGFVPEEHPAISPLTEQEAKDMKLGAVRGQIQPKTLREEVDLVEAITACVRGLLSEEEGFKLGKRVQKEEEVTSSNDSSQNDEVEVAVA